MNYKIEHETSSRLRIRVMKKQLSVSDEEKIHYVLDQIPGVKEILVYNATSGVAIFYEGCRQELLDALQEMKLEDVKVPADYIDTHDVVRMDELKKRHLGPKVKMRMRGKILAEMAFDLVAPTPIQVGYHLYQIVTLKNI